MRTRSLNIAVICALIGSILLSAIAGHVAVAAPTDASSAGSIVRTQDDGDDGEGTPEGGAIEPAEGQQGDDQGDSAGQAIELVSDLGNGGQPEGAPREIVTGDSRFLFDRIVPASSEAVLVAEAGDVRAFAREQEAPYDAIYLSLPGLGEEDAARYLPEQLEAPDTACPAEAADFERVDAGGTLYAFAGAESDLPEDALQEVGDNNGDPVYADLDVQQPFPELFFSTADGLLRFVVVGGDGRPLSLGESLAFNGTQFTFDSDATDAIDPASLTKVGCSTAFPVFAPAGTADGGFTQLYVLAGTRYFLFTGEGAAPQAPTEEATPPPPTEIPTQAATPPPVVPTEVLTEVPTALPTEVPTEVPTAVPTEVPTAIPTEVPTDVPTAVPTDAPVVVPADVPTEVPTAAAPATPPPAAPTDAPAATIAPPAEAATPPAAPTEAPAATVPPADAATPPAAPSDVTTTAVTPAPLPEEAVAAGLPPQLTVQNNTYVFNQVSVDVDITTLVQVEVVTIQNVAITVYAEQNVDVTQAPRLYCVGSNGQVVGQYIVVPTGGAVAPVAAVTPAPLPEEAVAAGLPPEVTIQNNTYVFNQVNVDIDITTLVQVEVITIQNVQVTVYAEQNVQINQAPRLYLVGANGQVVGQYVVVGTTLTTQLPPTAPIEPPAVVPTLPPNAPPPAVATAVPRTTCPGDPGAPNAQGLPGHLPTRVQLGGVAYTFIRAEAPDAVGTLTRIGCIGPFEAASTDQADRAQVIFLRYTGSGAASQQVYRFEAAVTYQIQFQVSDQPRTISTVDQRYQLRQVWQPSIHSSTTVILFVQDPANPAPEVIYGVNVSQTVVGDAIGEYRLPGETTTPSEEIVAAAERTGLNPDLTINGQVYLLVSVYEPTGTTSNGFITLFGAPAEGDPAMLLGRDKRELELFIFELDAPAETGG